MYVRRQANPAVEPSLAVLLNANAKQVDGDVRAALSSVVPSEDLFFSKCAGDAADIADTVVSRGYRTVFTGGGDGTFVSWVNHILDRAERGSTTPPRFGVLALGTGNAVAEAVGASPRDGICHDLERYLRGEVPAIRQLDLLTCGGRRTPFAGVGLDAAILNDYVWVREQLKGTARRWTSGTSGYALAATLRSVPRYLLQRRPSYCEIVNAGEAAWRLDGRGQRVGRPIAHGELLYAGPCMMAAASTVPYYGLGLRMFPFAGRQAGHMQLRVVSRISVPTVLWNLPSIWDGDFEHPGVIDFHAEKVGIRFERPMPLQVGGDAEGWRDQITFGMAERPVELVDFNVTTRLAA
jgi:diacylglycerol kinase family enzyme